MSTAATVISTFVYFTIAEHAEKIVDSMMLLPSRTIENAVYAVAVGGESCPGVQHACHLSDDGDYVTAQDGARAVAVLFTTQCVPHEIFAEEVIWRRDLPLPLLDAMIIDADEADEMLDGSAGIPDGGLETNGGVKLAGASVEIPFGKIRAAA